MMRGDFSLAKNGLAIRLLFGTLLVCVAASSSVLAMPQAGFDIPPDAAPQIQQANPAQAAPGAHVAVTIQGSNFSAGAYVSSVSAAVHIESSKRVSATQIEAQISVSATAQPGTVSLLVSNPASRAAETAFTIAAAPPASAPPVPTQSAEPPQATIPAATVTPAVEVKPSTAATPAVHVVPSAPLAQAASSGPAVTAITPPSVGRGFDVDLKITGKNFVQGTKVSFANSGIRVLGVTFSSGTELTAHIKVASDAPTGTASLFVINPDDNEVEAAFEVTPKGVATPATTSTPVAPLAPGSPDTQRFDAFHLGNPTEIIHTHGKVKGCLVISSGTVKYQEAGQTLINISLSEIKEVKTSSVATATFHITLNSGKTLHFAPASLRPSDARDIVDAVRKVLLH